MKINDKVLSVPPHISTNWANISSLHMKDAVLIVSLIDGETVHVPDLQPQVLEKIFEKHAEFLDNNFDTDTPSSSPYGMFPFSQIQSGDSQGETPFKFGLGALDNWGAAIQHNPSQANSPDLPPEVLEKIRSISKIIAPDDENAIPKPEPHCNCMHCQIARAINQGLGHPDLYSNGENTQVADSMTVEEVQAEELHFQQWDIAQKDDKLYTVTNRLDKDEQYNVYLGNPVGCTCGKQGCEHILAVLKS